MAQKERVHFGSKLGIILDSGLLLIFITTPNVFDFVTGQIFLPIGGILTCLFLGRYIPITGDERRVYELGNGWFEPLRSLFPLICYVCPLCILVFFLHQFDVI